MKRLSPRSILTCELLRFVRDHHHSLNEFAARFCTPGHQEFHILRKADLIRLIDDRIHLNPNLLSPCGRYFNLPPPPFSTPRAPHLKPVSTPRRTHLYPASPSTPTGLQPYSTPSQSRADPF